MTLFFEGVLWICGHQIQQVKVKFALEQATKTQRGKKVIAVLFLTSALVGGGYSTPSPGPFTHRNDPIHTVEKAAKAPRPVWKVAGNFAPTEFVPRTVQPVASCYTD